MITLLLILTLGIFQPDSSGNGVLEDYAREQAQTYIQQIERGNNIDLHLWALSMLCQHKQHPETIDFINSRIASSSSFQLIDQPFCSSESISKQLAELAIKTNYPNLLLAAIIKEENPNTRREMFNNFYKHADSSGRKLQSSYATLFKRIINDKIIDSSVLPLDSFTFAHYLVLTDKTLQQKELITDEFREKARNYWQSSNQNFNPPSLKHSLYQFTLFKVLYYTGNYSDTAALYPKLTEDKLFPISEERMNIYSFLDYSMYRLGYYDRSLETSRNFTVPLARFLNDKKKELSSLILQGGYLYQIGKIKEAQKIDQRVLGQLKNYDVTVSRSSLLNNLSLTYLKSGNFDKYLELQFQSLALAKKQNNYTHRLKILRNLHVIYRRRGDQKASQRYINEALELAKTSGDAEDLGYIYNSLGVFYRDLKMKPDSAAIYFEKAQNVIKNLDNFYIHIALLREKARLEEQLNQHENALAIYQKMQRLASSKDNSQIYLDTRVDEARILLYLDRENKVDKIIKELNNSDLSLLDFPEIIKAKTVQANFAIRNGAQTKAYEILKPAIKQIVERAQSSTDIQSGYWNVEQEYLDAFQLFVDLLIQTGRSQEAVFALDQLKTINDAALYQDPMVKASQLNETELTRYQLLAKQLDRLRKQQLSSSGRSTNRELQSKIDRLNAQKRALDRKITRYAGKPTINMDQVQRVLTSKDLVLHITELKNTYYIAKITRRAVEFQKVSLDNKTRNLFEQAIRELANGQTDLDKLYRLGKLLDLTDLPPLATNIILIPDSYLFQLPMDIIPISNPAHSYSYGGTSYFIEKYSTEYLTSLNELINKDRFEKKHNWDYVGFGISSFNSINENLMPLPYASREVRQISEELNNLKHNRTITEQQSTESTFREAAPEARILHLATHSKVSEQDPLFSTIYMNSSSSTQSDQEQFNSQVFAYELFEMNLSSDLIMLNSCESGSGSYLQGSGIVGFSRALRFAGAESLVLNLWSVNDMMASEFAIQFYKALNQGDTKSEALKKAKVHFLKNKNANPHYWGPYMLIGSDRAVVYPDRSDNILFASGFMFYLLCMVGLSYFVQKCRNPFKNRI